MWSKKLALVLSIAAALLVLAGVAAFDRTRHTEIATELPDYVTLITKEDSGIAVSVSTESTAQTESVQIADLGLSCQARGGNTYALTWNEVAGASYAVQLSEDGEHWQTIAEIPADQECSYTTQPLEAFQTYWLSVTAVGVQTHSEPVTVTTEEKLLYSTIWPLMDQPVYGDAAATQKLGTASAGSSWCVLGMEGQYLKIRFDGQDGYIDSDYCMINLPEYVGQLCNYNITNSYCSAFLVHEYEIDNVSGTVLAGYENVQTGEGTYLVPLLFPAAQKLINAGQSAREQGYTLTIYDSFRPKNTTDQIYSRTTAILDDVLPETTFRGRDVTDLDLLAWKGKTVTYQILMTNNGAYNLGSFLAPGNSRHNFGVAVDLTMVDVEGREVAMQTPIHDLSWYSATDRNNSSADLLRKFMMDAGFKDLVSEWWHFSDAELYNRNAYKPLKTGVSWACWVYDGTGWRYRMADGSFYTDCTEVIGENTYTFDANGYTNY